MNDKINLENELKSSQLYELLEQIQLEKFWPILLQAQITQITHFNYVKPKDLEALGMSKPAIRRLLDTVNKFKKQPPPRPAPPLPQQASTQLSNQSKLYNNNLNNTRVLTTNKNINSSKKSTHIKSTDSQNSSVSVIINQQDLQIVKNSKGEDEILGKGNFGLVKKALWSSHTGAKLQVAVKCLHNTSESDAITDLINEISCMCGLDHKNLIKLYGIVLNSTNLMMVTEIAPNGSLYTYLRKKREKKLSMQINKLYSYVYQIASGMEYLETKKLIHRDLAARNILLFTYDHVKICDFGMTRSVKNEHNEIFTMKENHKIPAAWFPPEAIREKIFSIKSDVWMFGVTVWEIFTLCEHPWPNMTAAEILNKIDNECQRLALPYLCSKSFYKIIYQCWSRNPADRPSFQILKKLIQSTKIIEMKARSDFKEEDRLEITSNDMITVIDGDAAKYWWKGQNNRTLQVGFFPRAILNPLRKLDGQDISLPLKNSLIHTGHMGPSGNEKNWGNPSKIDPIFLISMNPPDLLSDLADEDVKNFIPNNTNDESKTGVQIVNSILSNQQPTEDLIDLLDFNSDTIQISYPDYTGSIDSFSSFYDYNSSQLQSKQQVSSMIPLVPNNQASNQSYVNTNNKSIMNDYLDNTTNRIYYNDDVNLNNKYQTTFRTNEYENSQIIQQPQYQPQQKQINQLHLPYRQPPPPPSQSLNMSHNPFLHEMKELQSKRQHQQQLNHMRRFSQPNTSCSSSSSASDSTHSKIDVDDFYKKVCNDVMNDLNKIKINNSK